MFLTTDALPMCGGRYGLLQAPQVVLDALKERLDHGVFGYAFQDQDTQQAVAEWLTRRHGRSIQTGRRHASHLELSWHFSFAVQAFTSTE